MVFTIKIANKGKLNNLYFTIVKLKMDQCISKVTQLFTNKITKQDMCNTLWDIGILLTGEVVVSLHKYKLAVRIVVIYEEIENIHSMRLGDYVFGEMRDLRTIRLGGYTLDDFFARFPTKNITVEKTEDIFLEIINFRREMIIRIEQFRIRRIRLHNRILQSELEQEPKPVLNISKTDVATLTQRLDDALNNLSEDAPCRGDKDPQLITRLKKDVQDIKFLTGQFAFNELASANVITENKSIENSTCEVCFGKACSVCYSNQIDVAVFPCAHAKFCRVCVVKVLQNENKQCPYCKATIEKVVPIFL